MIATNFFSSVWGGGGLDHDFKETSKQVVNHIKFWNKLGAQLVEAFNLMFPKLNG